MTVAVGCLLTNIAVVCMAHPSAGAVHCLSMMQLCCLGCCLLQVLNDVVNSSGYGRNHENQKVDRPQVGWERGGVGGGEGV